jgi:CheY-like chemotaxis protein
VQRHSASTRQTRLYGNDDDERTSSARSCDARRYAAALIDLNLADVDGNEVIRAARTAKPDMPIIMMSGMVLESGRDTPAFLGPSVKTRGVHRLAKPFKPKDLLQLMEEILPQQDIPLQRTAVDAGGR